MIRTGPTNEHLQDLITELSKLHSTSKVKLWRAVAKDLSKSTRSRSIVNLVKIDRLARDGETVVVPGKVLGSGEISRKLTVSAFNFSKSAKEKIEQKGGKAMTINELIRTNPKGSKVRIIG